MECDMSATHEAYDVYKYQHSDRISSRRKALFPAVCDDNSDLGPMTPLSDTNSNPCDYISNKCNEEIKTFKEYFSVFRNNIDNYIIMDKDSRSNEPDETCDTADLDHHSLSSSSPLNLQQDSPSILNAKTQETPIIESPTKNLKTPHDTSTCSVKIPKLIRKHNGESMHDIETGKHNFSPTESPSIKIQKLDSNSFCKMSKVRTALFPDISFPTRSFYPKSDQKKTDKSPKVFNYKERIPKVKSAPTYLCNRRPSNRNRFGQINAGVRHKIKKPKQKMTLKVGLRQATMSLIQSAQLIEFIKEVKMMTEARPKLITVLNNCEEKNAENLSVESNKTSDSDVNNEESLILNKKFFKSRLIKNTDNPIVDSISGNEKTTVAFDVLDFINDDDQDLTVPSLDKILSTLTTEEEDTGSKTNTSSPNRFVLRASNTISDSDNSILFHYPHDQSRFTNCKDRKRKLEDKENNSADVLLSPTSQMCDMTSGLAINSPKRAKLNITNILENSRNITNNINVFNKVSSSSEMEKQKLFPIFHRSHNLENKEVVKSTNSKTTVAKKWKNLSEDQMLLDAGQKRFGYTQCPECQLVYHMGDPSEEIMHHNYHSARNILSFKGWKNENVVGSLPDARIIKVSPGDPKIWWKKIKDLVEVVNRDLGYYEMEFNIDKSAVFLYIKNKSIVGCLVGEPKSEGFKMLSSFEGIDVCSTEAYPIKCGISRIWVCQNNRQKGVGTALMDCIRKNFSYGYILKREEIALSSPTELGKLFARKYFQTENFFIYTS